jgi:hypothetical protein
MISKSQEGTEVSLHFDLLPDNPNTTEYDSSWLSSFNSYS